MPDISLCLNKQCPSRIHCYRYRAKPNEYRQSYSTFKHEGQRCAHYQSTSGWDDRYIKPMKELEPMEGQNEHT